jgi:HD-GYP domain-containing protein (c-di-GMP phosphodiesterase class II)
MTTDRPYRRRLSVEEARRRLRKAAGTQFDPRVVEVFLALDAPTLAGRAA